jgi:hypothetical protein
MPCVNWKTTKEDIMYFWSKNSFDLKLKSEIYGNCDLCFLKGKGKLSIIANEKPELFDFWINHEEKLDNKGGAFKKEITYRQLKERSQSQKGLFDGDPSFECFCNTD